VSVAANREVVQRYFDAVHTGDMATVESLLDENVTFWVPPSLPDGVEFRGREAVLSLFRESVALYDTTAGLSVEIDAMTAEEDRVAVELRIRGRSAASGEPYHNHYHFLFRIREGRVVAIREHLDSLYAFRTLFEPAGINSRADCRWIR